jgi:[ribosomal protein S5]-alanine N-acetyltransferase
MQETTLELLPVQEFHKVALRAGKPELSSLLGVKLFDAWPTFPEAFASRDGARNTADVLANEWPGYFFIDRAQRCLVGNGGFVGPPTESGIVEIGYEIAREVWGHGYATNAVNAMLRYAFAHAQVRFVQAHTLAEKNASNRVLEKVGMHFAGEVPNDEFGVVWRWQIAAPN